MVFQDDDYVEFSKQRQDKVGNLLVEYLVISDHFVISFVVLMLIHLRCMITDQDHMLLMPCMSGVNSIDINLGPKIGPKIVPRCKSENTVLKLG